MSRILFIDAYDSFSNNIIKCLKSILEVPVESIHIDDSRFVFNDDAFHDFLQHFDAVVAGPGPGHPANADDIGLIAKLWTLPNIHALPVLGICLGFQSLALAFGAEIRRLKYPRHGLITTVTHCGKDLFAGTGEILATQYHSLHAKLPGMNSSMKDLWTTSEGHDRLLPLAWDLSDTENGPILMAAMHRTKPFWGVQYHPESISSNAESRLLVKRWWQEACTWGISRQRETKAFNRIDIPHRMLNPEPLRIDPGSPRGTSVEWLSAALPCHSDTAIIVETLRRQCHDSEVILLESCVRKGKPVNAETGRYSILGISSDTVIHLQYCTRSGELIVHSGGKVLDSATTTASGVFDYLDMFMQERKAAGGFSGSPFWGGLMGLISYEAGLQTIEVACSDSTRKKPDIWFVFVERSVVIDHVAGTFYVQSLLPDDRNWLDEIMVAVSNVSRTPQSSPLPTPSPLPPANITSQPDKDTYCDKVTTCQSHLGAGLSYELCLTDQTHILSHEEPWTLYLRLRDQNPAPFGAYLSFTTPLEPDCGAALVSSSPERFLSWTREGKCQFRPIKGTVRKAPGVTLASAEAILKSPKEQAENLMIVDLIRHDLSGVPGISNISVPQLMAIEEYATVYQLVSVITGTLKDPSLSGIPILASSLPPGSMTGAPKKRSCTLLTEIEEAKPRGFYSGVLGYFDVGGGGDFSVVIRSAFKYTDENVWRVGAGGAVTVLSEAAGEWEEMVAKREALLKVFGVA